jgi:hypothetical protein
MLHNSGSSFSLVYLHNKLCCILFNVPLALVSTRYGKERPDVHNVLLALVSTRYGKERTDVHNVSLAPIS